jgi:hypothetical protein
MRSTCSDTHRLSYQQCTASSTFQNVWHLGGIGFSPKRRLETTSFVREQGEQKCCTPGFVTLPLTTKMQRVHVPVVPAVERGAFTSVGGIRQRGEERGMENKMALFCFITCQSQSLCTISVLNREMCVRVIRLLHQLICGVLQL